MGSWPLLYRARASKMASLVGGVLWRADSLSTRINYSEERRQVVWCRQNLGDVTPPRYPVSLFSDGFGAWVLRASHQVSHRPAFLGIRRLGMPGPSSFSRRTALRYLLVHGCAFLSLCFSALFALSFYEWPFPGLWSWSRRRGRLMARFAESIECDWALLFYARSSRPVTRSGDLPCSPLYLQNKADLVSLLRPTRDSVQVARRKQRAKPDRFDPPREGKTALWGFMARPVKEAGQEEEPWDKDCMDKNKHLVRLLHMELYEKSTLCNHIVAGRLLFWTPVIHLHIHF